MAGWDFDRAGRRNRGGRKFQQGAQAIGEDALARQGPSEGASKLGAPEGQPEQAGAGQHGSDHRAQGTVMEGAGVGGLDIGAGVVDQMHVVHAGRACGHAGEAGQAAIDMADHFLGCGTPGLQHVLDEIDAAARAIEFIAEQDEGGAGRGAEAAMHAGSQDLVGNRGIGVAQLRIGKVGLHGGSAPAQGVKNRDAKRRDDERERQTRKRGGGHR